MSGESEGKARGERGESEGKRGESEGRARGERGESEFGLRSASTASTTIKPHSPNSNRSGVKAIHSNRSGVKAKCPRPQKHTPALYSSYKPRMHVHEYALCSV